MRFYFAKYLDSATSAEKYGVTIQKKYGMRHTLFMVPTYFNGQRHVDFDPFLTNSEDVCKPMPLSALIKSKDYLKKTATGNYGNY